MHEITFVASLENVSVWAERIFIYCIYDQAAKIIMYTYVAIQFSQAKICPALLFIAIPPLYILTTFPTQL